MLRIKESYRKTLIALKTTLIIIIKTIVYKHLRVITIDSIIIITLKVIDT
jgi:hypothetical protein